MAQPKYLFMNNPALTLALAMVFGMIAQITARHLRIPGIVLLLGTGIILGPTVLGIVHPASLGSALPLIVGFAVAVILFEGGMNLRLKRVNPGFFVKVTKKDAIKLMVPDPRFDLHLKAQFNKPLHRHRG
mgnify:CR=1 FL=1